MQNDGYICPFAGIKEQKYSSLGDTLLATQAIETLITLP